MSRRAADLTSYAVVDFTGDRDAAVATNFVTGLLDRAAIHGLVNVQYQKNYAFMTEALMFKSNVDNAHMVQQVRII